MVTTLGDRLALRLNLATGDDAAGGSGAFFPPIRHNVAMVWPLS